MEHMHVLNEEATVGYTGTRIDCGCRAKRRRLLNVLLWCVLLYAILSLRNLPGDDSHRLCGPWGCLPPIQALAAVLRKSPHLSTFKPEDLRGQA